MPFHRTLCLFQIFFSSTWAITSIFHFKWVLPIPIKIHPIKIFTRATPGIISSLHIICHIFYRFQPKSTNLSIPINHWFQNINCLGFIRFQLSPQIVNQSVKRFIPLPHSLQFCLQLVNLILQPRILRRAQITRYCVGSGALQNYLPLQIWKQKTVL